MKQEYKKYLIGAVVVAIIILVIIFIRNRKKNKEAELAKSKLIAGTTTPIPTTNVGKTALVKSSNTTFYNIGTMNIAYTKSSVGEFAGTITGDATDSGNTSFYKIINTSGTSLYVLKSQVTVK